MRKLLSAGLVRLTRSRALWLSCAAAAGYEIFSVLSRYKRAASGWEVRYDLDGCFFLFAGMAGIVSALVCAFLIGPEHGDGALRNKLIVGHSRGSVYLTNLILSAAASLLTCLAAILPGLALGIPLLGGFKMGAARACMMILGICALSVAYAGIFTAMTMLITNRVVSLTSAVILALALLMAGSYLNGRLSASPVIPGYGISESGQPDVNLQPNPAYIPEGPWRSTLELLYDFLPGGQTGQYVTGEVSRPGVLMLYDALIFAAATAAGLMLFRRKDLK